jgi:hypothetical protein
MHLLACWVWENFQTGLAEEFTYRFSSNQPRLHSEIQIGESLWLVGFWAPSRT